LKVFAYVGTTEQHDQMVSYLVQKYLANIEITSLNLLTSNVPEGSKVIMAGIGGQGALPGSLLVGTIPPLDDLIKDISGAREKAEKVLGKASEYFGSDKSQILIVEPLGPHTLKYLFKKQPELKFGDSGLKVGSEEGSMSYGELSQLLNLLYRVGESSLEWNGKRIITDMKTIEVMESERADCEPTSHNSSSRAKDVS